MLKKLHLISCVEDSERFLWESAVQLKNMRGHGYSDKFRIIVFLPAYHKLEGFSPKWKKLEKMFPETKFFYYQDNERNSVTDLMVNYDYIPIHRLCSLEKHFKEHKELTNDAILYIDSDVLFIQAPDIEQYIQDDVNYLSDTHTYLNADYFDSKKQKEKDGSPKFVREDKYEEFCTKDFLAQCTKFSGITREICEKNNKNTGGAQYLLKNMSSKFFSECIDSCLLIRMYLQQMGQTYFKGETSEERENNSWQSWASDMFAIQWNLWRHNLPSETPKWMNFAWASEEIPEKEYRFLFHNAGITTDGVIRATSNLVSLKNEDGSPKIVDAPAFSKNSFKRISPFQAIEELEKIVSHPISQKYYTSFYVQEILDTYNSLIKQ